MLVVLLLKLLGGIMDSIELRELFQMIGEREVKIFQLQRASLNLQNELSAVVNRHNALLIQLEELKKNG